MACRWTLRNSAGEELEFTEPFFLRESDGMGLPDPGYIVATDSGLDGALVIGGYAQERRLQFALELYAASPSELAQMRDRLYSLLADFSRECTLRCTREDGTVREIAVRYAGNLTMPVKAGEVQSQSVVLSLVAHSPWPYDPEETIWLFGLPPGVEQFGFPLDFPVSFGSGGLEASTTRTYAGQIPCYPVIEAYGPMTGLVIRNVTTGEKLDLSSYHLEVGRMLSFNLNQRFKTVTLDDGTLLTGYLSADSDLGTFHLEAHPKAWRGANELSVQASGCTSNSFIRFRFHTLYAGF